MLGLVIAAVVLELALGATTDVLVATVGVGLTITGLLPLILTRGRHLSWIVLFAIGALCVGWVAMASGPTALTIG